MVYYTCFGRLCGVLVMKDAMGSERERGGFAPSNKYQFAVCRHIDRFGGMCVIYILGYMAYLLLSDWVSNSGYWVDIYVFLTTFRY